MKKINLFFVFYLFCFFLTARLLPVKNTFQTGLAKVISDYPDRFKNIAGELLIENPQ